MSDNSRSLLGTIWICATIGACFSTAGLACFGLATIATAVVLLLD